MVTTPGCPRRCSDTATPEAFVLACDPRITWRRRPRSRQCHCDKSDREDRTYDGICFKPSVECALVLRGQLPIVKCYVARDAGVASKHESFGRCRIGNSAAGNPGVVTNPGPQDPTKTILIDLMTRARGDARAAWLNRTHATAAVAQGCRTCPFKADRTRRGHVLARSRVVIDVLDRGRTDDDGPPRPVGGIGAHGNVVQIVLKPSHGIQRLGDRPLLRGPILGCRFLRGGGAWLRLGRGFGGAPSLGNRRRLAARRINFAPLLRDVSFFGDRRRR